MMMRVVLLSLRRLILGMALYSTVVHDLGQSDPDQGIGRGQLGSNASRATDLA